MAGEKFTMEMLKMAHDREWEGSGVLYSASDSSCFVDPVPEEGVMGSTVQMLIEMTVVYCHTSFL